MPNPKNLSFFFVFMAVCLVSSLFADSRDVVPPKVEDSYKRVIFTHQELGGEIDRRLTNLIYNHYMVIDADSIWLDKFIHRVDRLHSEQPEYVYYGIGKLIDAGSLMARYSGDSRVAERTDHIIDTLLSSRDPDGYLGFWIAEPENRQDHINWILHEQEYINLALVRNWRTTGNPRSLEAAKVMGDYILKTFPTPENPVYDPSLICTAGLPEGMLELYRVTGDARYLDFASNTPHGNNHGEIKCDTLLNWRQDFSHPEWSHVYVMLARCYAQTELYRLTGGEGLLEMSHFMIHELLKKGEGGILVTGACSEGEHFVYNQNGSGSVGESCANAYEVRLLDSLLRLTGNLKYGDVMERTIYNSLFAANSPDGRWIRYFTPFTGKRIYDTRDYFCCCGNFRRALAEIPEKICYRTPGGGICINLFTDFQKEFDITGKSVILRQDTDYPNSGLIRTTISAAEPIEFELQFRIPRWGEEAVLSINSEEPIKLNPQEMQNGGYSIRRTWTNGDIVKLEIPMPWRLIRGRANQEGRAALMRGPIVYTLGSDLNPQLFQEENFDPRTLTLLPDSLEEPFSSSLVRPDGLAVQVKMKKESGEIVDVILTEFPDPSGQEIYFKIPEGTNLCEDEIVSE